MASPTLSNLYVGMYSFSSKASNLPLMIDIFVLYLSKYKFCPNLYTYDNLQGNHHS